jgi:hypothetical protein
LSPPLLAFEFLRQFTLEPFLFSRFQKKGMSLYILNNAFLLDLSLEAAKDALDGFPLENSDFCQMGLLEIRDRTVGMNHFPRINSLLASFGLSVLARCYEFSHFFDRRKYPVALAGIAGLTTDDESRFGAHQELLLALRKEMIPCGPGSVVIPIDHL